MWFTVRGVRAFEIAPPPRPIQKAAHRNIVLFQRVAFAFYALAALAFITVIVNAVLQIDGLDIAPREVDIVLVVLMLVLAAIYQTLKKATVKGNSIQKQILKGELREFYVTSEDYSLQVVMSDLDVAQFDDEALEAFFKRSDTITYDEWIRNTLIRDSHERAAYIAVTREKKLVTLRIARGVFGDHPILDEKEAAVEADLQKALPTAIQLHNDEKRILATLTQPAR